MTIDEIKSIITPLVSPYPVSRVILFGSYARGDASECSDVDLIIDSEGILSGFDFFGMAGLIMKKMPIEVDIFELREINRPSIMFDNIDKEGVVIYESQNTKTA
jgi:predicted nucleotidyltransferase